MNENQKSKLDLIEKNIIQTLQIKCYVSSSNFFIIY